MATTTASRAAASGRRLHGLDALRAGALLLGIVFHATFPYSPIPWVVNDVARTDAVLPFIAVSHLFRMTVFMLIAGYFGRMVVGRRGPGAYLKDRLLRITLPVLVFWPVAVLPLGLLSAWATRRLGLPPITPPPGFGLLEALTPGHLWFLVVLTQCVLVTLVVRRLCLRIWGERAARATATAGRVLSGPWALPLTAIPYAAAILMQGTAEGGLIGPVTILGSPSSLVGYLSAFLVGWALHAAGDGLRRIARTPWAYLVAAVVFSYATLELAPGRPLLVEAVACGLAGWAWTLALLGLCVRFLTRERRWIRYLADASYWMYLVHLPLVIAAEILIADRPWPIAVKLALVLAVTLPLMLGSYELLVRHTWLGRWLNGRTHPRRGARRGEPALAS